MSDRRNAEKAGEIRSPPKNLEAEQALLGAILVNNEAIHLVSSFLEPEHFFMPVHGRIYAAVMQMVGRQETANPVTLKPYFRTRRGAERGRRRAVPRAPRGLGGDGHQRPPIRPPPSTKCICADS